MKQEAETVVADANPVQGHFQKARNFLVDFLTIHPPARNVSPIPRTVATPPPQPPLSGTSATKPEDVALEPEQDENVDIETADTRRDIGSGIFEVTEPREPKPKKKDKSKGKEKKNKTRKRTPLYEDTILKEAKRQGRKINK